MDEQLIKNITETVLKNLSGNGQIKKDDLKIPVGISARHIHLTREHVEILFGKGYQLTKKKELMGGQYACEECVTITGAKLRAIESVRIIGPERKATQIEISKTDAIKLGVNPPVRDSGSIKGSVAMSVNGPCGSIFIDEGCIVAKRHIHMSPDDAKRFNVEDGTVVSVKFDTERGGIFNDCLVRVDKTFTLEMHIDTDEANAFGISGKDFAQIIK